MKTFTKKSHFLTMALLFLLPFSSPLAQSTDDIGVLIDKAGKQRMLTQKIAKAYLFLGQGIRTDKARSQMTKGIDEFIKAHEELKKETTDEEALSMLAYLDVGMEELKGLVNSPYSKENAATVIDLSEALLEGSQEVVVVLKKGNNATKTSIVDVSGRQRMLSQRIAKFYIAYRAGFHDQNIIDQLNAAVTLFEKSHKELVANKANTEVIANDLKRVGILWGVVHKFYTNVEKGKLPTIVFTTTDSIMTKMNTITGEYAKTEKVVK